MMSRNGITWAGRPDNDGFVEAARPRAHHHPVSQRHGLTDIVGHKQDRRLRLAPQVQELIVQIPAGEGIQRGEWFVQQQHARIGPECPGDGDPLLLPTGQLARPAVGMLRQTDPFQCPDDPAPTLGSSKPGKAEADIVRDIKPGQESRFLEDDADIRMRLADRLAVDLHASAASPGTSLPNPASP